MTYSIVGITAILIHLILNFDFLKDREEKTDADIAFKRYTWAAVLYCISDAFWGIINDLHIPALLYADTLLYYVSMALTILLLCRYVTTYLNLKSGFGKFINYFGLFFCLLEISLLVVNHFVHIFFWIDSAGNYQAYSMRYVAFYMQVLLCSLLAVTTGSVMNKATNEMRKKYFTIFLFCIEMTVAILFQIMYPLLPGYAAGLVIGICIIHTFIKAHEKEAQYEVLKSLADIYYSMHVIDLTNDTVTEFNAKHEVKEIVNQTNGAAKMMNQIMSVTTVDEYKEAALAFTDLTTLAERMQGEKIITAQFIGHRTGWYLALFIALETDAYDKPTKVIYTTRIIDDEKKQEESLIFKSQTDELTGLYNRRAYEEDIYEMTSIPNDYIYIALDVNGLKVVNDTIGHAAGDELIVAASHIMKQVLGSYGKVYRTGGDEFVAIEYISEAKLKDLLEEFDETIAAWSGNLVDSLSISYGYVSKEEFPDYTAPQFATEADKRMYQAKSAYYRRKGVDRRGQQDAHRALCETYTKILKINLTEDSHQVINMVETERDSQKGFADKISEWLKGFALSGQVHPDDLEEYLANTSLDFMREYFKTNSTLVIIYRRRYGDEYKRVMMEMIPANDYSNDNQSLFLYVKRIEK